METRIWNKTRIWNTFADDQVVFHIRVYTVEIDDYLRTYSMYVPTYQA